MFVLEEVAVLKKKFLHFQTPRVDAGGSSAHEGAMEETSKRQSRKQRQQLLRRKTREDDQADLLLNARGTRGDFRDGNDFAPGLQK